MFGVPVLVTVFCAVLLFRLASAVRVLAVTLFTIEVVGLGSALATCTRTLKLKNPFAGSVVVGFHTIVPATGEVCATPNVSVI
jgi:hypothetical protein